MSTTTDPNRDAAKWALQARCEEAFQIGFDVGARNPGGDDIKFCVGAGVAAVINEVQNTIADAQPVVTL
jgi:hypothetical protein